MAYELKNRLVVGVASSALFDLTESDSYFREHGEDAYRDFQDQHIDSTLGRGVAFPFISRLLGLNNLREQVDPLVEVIVLSKNDPSTGLRVLRSIRTYGLTITRAVFTQGQAPYKYIGAFDMSLFLSGNRADVDAATALGYPAGHVLPSTAVYDDGDQTLRIAFGFDGVLGDDEAERIYKETGSLKDFQEHETKNRDRALIPGPLNELLRDLNLIQRLESKKKATDSNYEPRVRISLVTARNAPAHERAVQSLAAWDVTVNDAFFLGGIAKSKVLEVMRPHIFFDDQKSHLDPASSFVAGVHVPFGVANEGAAHEPGAVDFTDSSGNQPVEVPSPRVEISHDANAENGFRAIAQMPIDAERKQHSAESLPEEFGALLPSIAELEAELSRGLSSEDRVKQGESQ